MKHTSALSIALCGLALAGQVAAAPNTLKGGSEYEQRLQQSGMSGMSGMSSGGGTTSGAPAKSAKKKAAKAKKPTAEKAAK